MKKLSPLLMTLLVPAIAFAFAVQSCATGETSAAGSGGSNGSGSGGNNSSSSGGSNNNGSGGSNSSGSGGRVSGSGGSNTTGSGGRVGSGGSTTSGSGGSIIIGSGGAMMTGSGGATVGACSGANASAMNGYIMTSTWKGYAFTLTGGMATVSPVCGATGTCYMTAGTSVCAMGTVMADTTYNSVGGWGWNISQAMATPNPAMAIAPGGTGLAVNAPGATAMMRLQISDGGSPTEVTWCAPMPANGMGTVPWGSFTKTCYDTANPGAAYTATTPIAKAQIIVPSNAGSAVPFCFCVVSMGPA